MRDAGEAMGWLKLDSSVTACQCNINAYVERESHDHLEENHALQLAPR